jgi:hypothetical protein
MKKRQSLKCSSSGEGILKESFIPATDTAEIGYSAQALDVAVHSPEARQRRLRLIREINAGWSEKSETALSKIAGQFFDVG